MTSRFVMLGCFVACIGCGPAVDADLVAETGSTSMDDGSTATTSEDTATPPVTTGEVSTSSAMTTEGPTTSGAESSTGAGVESSSGEPFEADCDRLCGELVEGSCVGLEQDCTVTCQDAVGSQGDAVAAAFGACVSTQPLCFSHLEDCMWSELYGEDPVEQRYVLEGSGFDAWEGRSVRGVLSVSGESQPGSTATIERGQFMVESTVITPFDGLSNQRTFYFFVDADDDGACTDADFVQATWLENLGSDFSEPVFVLETTPEAASAVAFCGQF